MRNIFSFKAIILAWTSFYLACQGVGRPDIPQKLLLEFHKKTMVHISKPWGCPSIYNKNACYRFKIKNSHK